MDRIKDAQTCCVVSVLEGCRFVVCTGEVTVEQTLSFKRLYAGR